MSNNPFVRWLKNLLPPTSQRQRRKSARTHKRPTESIRPAVELLEDRTVPTTWNVTSSSGANAAGSLRYILTNNAQAGDTITFASSITAITLATASGAIAISKNITITGNTGNSPVISGNGKVQVLNVNAGVTTTISSLTIIDGAAASGAGINNAGTLTLNNSTVGGTVAGTYNVATASGGGIYNSGSLTMTGDIVAGNQAKISGGAIYNKGGATLTLTTDTVTGNTSTSATSYGGGIYNAGTGTFIGDTIASNQAKVGAGIYVASGSLTLSTASFAISNIAATAMGSTSYSVTATSTTGLVVGETVTIAGTTGFNGSFAVTSLNTPTANTFTITSTANIVTWTGTATATAINVISGNTASGSGGGIYNIGALTSTDSTVSTNQAPKGGGIYNTGNLTSTTDLITENITGSTKTGSGGGIYNTGSASLTMDTISGNTAGKNGGGLYENSPTSLTLYGDTISGNAADKSNGGGLYLASGSLTLASATVGSSTVSTAVDTNTAGGSGAGVFSIGNLTLSSASISDNVATSKGGGIYTTSALTLNLATIDDNTAGKSGGGVYTSGTLTINNATIDDNIATADKGGGIYGNSATLKNGSVATPVLNITGNSADKSGGGIFQDGGTVLLTNVFLSDNASTSAGGGGIANNAGTLTLTNSTITANEADKYGGGIKVAGSTSLVNCTVSNNEATSAGGGIYDGGSLTLTAVTLSDNSASTNGGGLFVLSGALTLSNDIITGNYAYSDGGGIFYKGSSSLTLINCTLSDNNATSTGGGIYSNKLAAILTLSNCTIANNLATDNGGAIYSTGTLTLTGCTISNNSATSNGGAIYSTGVLTLSSLTTNTGSLTSISSVAPTVAGSTSYTVTATSTTGFLAGDAVDIAGTTGFNGIYTVTGVSANTFTITATANTAAWSGTGTAAVGPVSSITGVAESSPGSTTYTVTGTPTATTIATGDNVTIANTTGFNGTYVITSVNSATGTFTITAAANITTWSGNGTATVSVITPTTVTGNVATSSGGGIYSTGVATLTNVTLAGNNATSNGGAIYSLGSLTLSGCTLTENNAASSGGAIASAGTLTLNSSSNTQLANILSISASMSGSTSYVATAGSTTNFASGDSVVIAGTTGFNGTYTITGVNASANTFTFTDTANITSWSGTGTATATYFLGDTFDGNIASYSGGGLDTFTSILTAVSAIAPTTAGSTSYVVTATSTVGFYLGDSVTLAGTTGFDGTYTITSVTNTALMKTFDITAAANIATWAGSATATATIGFTGTATNAAFSSNSGTNGGAIYNAGTLTLTGSTIQNNSASTNGGGVYNAGTLTLTGGTIENNIATTDGGGIYNSGSLTLTGTTINANEADDGGGINNAGSMTLTGAIITNNDSTTNGGGIYNSGSLTLTDTTLSDNDATSDGGGVYNSGTLTLNELTTGNLFKANVADTAGGALYNAITGTVQQNSTAIPNAFVSNSAATSGGAIYNAGRLTLTNATFSANSAYYYGGAIFNAGTMSLTSCQITGNSASTNGGGITNTGSLNLTNDTITGNTISDAYPSSGGAGIYNATSGTLVLSNSIVSNNYASDGGGGGIFNAGTATLTGATISHNTCYTSGGGGGINNSGTLTLVNSLVTYNCAHSTTSGCGGGILNSGKMSLSNDTIVGNTSYAYFAAGTNGGVLTSGGGGGVFNSGSLSLANVTISENVAYSGAGGGLYNAPTGTLTLTNSIVSGDISSNFTEVWGHISGNNNLFGPSYGYIAGVGSNNIYNTDPQLSPLANNGGPTETMAIAPGSPAIGKGGAITTIMDSTNGSATTLYVNNASAIASTPGQYFIQVDGEEMAVTNVNTTTNTLTVDRDLNNVPANTITATDPVYLYTDQRGIVPTTPPDIGAYQYVAPTVTPNTGDLPRNATGILISGTHFSTNPTDDTVSFDNGVTGTVTSVSNNTLDVTFTGTGVTGVPGVVLHASVTVDGVTSAVEPVGTVSTGNQQIPTITPSSANLSDTSTTLTIYGSHFDSTAANNSVTFTDGAVGSVTSATTTSLTVTLTTPPFRSGILSAAVTTNLIPSGSFVEVAAVAPGVATSTADLVMNEGTLVIDGFGFDPLNTNDSVQFTDGAVGTVTSATPTSLTVTFTTQPTGLGSLTGEVTVDSASSGSYVQVATVIPAIISTPASLPSDAIGVAYNQTLTITGGTGTFTSLTVANFNAGSTGLTSADITTNPSAGTVTISGTPTAIGKATFTLEITDSGGDTIDPAYGIVVTPTVTMSTSDLAANVTTLTIYGTGFDSTAGNDIVTFTDGASGSVTSATSTSLTVTLYPAPTSVGILSATVTVDSISSGAPVQVATVIAAIVGTPGTLPNAYRGVPYNETVTFAGGTGTFASFTMTNLSVGSTGLTAGNFTVNPINDTVTISGTPTATGTCYFTVNITDSAGDSVHLSYYISVLLPAFSPATLPGGHVGSNYTETLTADEGVAPYTSLALYSYNFAANGTGFTISEFTPNLSAGTITINGTPTGTGTASFTAYYYDSEYNYYAESFSITVSNSQATTTSLTDAGPNPSLASTGLYTVSVSAGAAVNGETVSIDDGGTAIATETLTNGTTTFSLPSLSSGTHSLTAVYSGDSSYQGSTSNILTQTIQSTFGVVSATATPNGVVLTFNAPINPSTTVLYTSPGDTTYGAADITVVGPGGAAERGSLVIDPTDPYIATFIQTNGVLTSGTYTVTVTTAVQAVGGGTMTGNYSTTLTVTSPTTPVLSVPGFARGPGQSVVLPNSTGIPINISAVTNLTQASFTLTYDSTLLTIDSSGALMLSSAASTAGVSITSYSINSSDPHHTVLTVNLGGGSLTTTATSELLAITASVPDGAPYLDKSLLNLSGVTVNSAAGTGVSGVDVVAYLGDVLGTGLANATDASLVDQVGSGAGTGFSEFKDLDPSIIGSTNGGLFVNANDASLINEAGSGASVAQIPPVPTLPMGTSLTFGGPDPYLYLSAVQGAAGQTATETLYLDVTDPNGIQLTALDEAIGFDAGELQISNVRGAAGLGSLGSYDTAGTVDNNTGVLLVGQAFMGSGLPPIVPYGTDIAVLQFDVRVNADAPVGEVSGLTLLQDGSVNGQLQYTAISDNEGALTWTPGKAPSNNGNVAVDGSVTVVAAAASEAAEVAASTPQRSVVVTSRGGVVVHRVSPAESVDQPETSTVALATTLTSSSEIVGTLVPAEELAATRVVSLPPSLPAELPMAGGQATSSTTASPTQAPEVVQTGSAVSGVPRVGDSSASLSVAALAASKSGTVASPVTSSARTLTNVIDEMYRQLGTLPPMSSGYGYNLAIGGEETLEDMDYLWEPEELPVDLDGSRSD